MHARLEGVDISGGDTWYDGLAMKAGIPDDTGMDGTLTCEHLFIMLYRYAQSEGLGFASTWPFQMDYPDADAVSEYAYEAMCQITMDGISSVGNSSFDPQGWPIRA